MSRILLLTHSFNSLTQRIYVELAGRGHDVSVEFDVNDQVTIEAVTLFQPDLILAPFLKRAIPEVVWRNHLCLIVHPGIKGDRGASALDWAILNDERQWGVTVLQAEAEMDAGPIWAECGFRMRPASKSSLYRAEVTEAAVEAVLLALERFESGQFTPEPLDPDAPDVRGCYRPITRQRDRAINWQTDTTEIVLRKIRSADGTPGVKDELFGRPVYLHDAHAAPTMFGPSGIVLAKSGPAICRATVDGAVWIGHLRAKDSPHPFKLPATQVLAEEVSGFPEIPIDSPKGYKEIHYEEANGVGYLHFAFYNGAMSTGQCQRLLAAYNKALSRDTKVIVLMGGPDFWSNGMNLNVIEAAPSAADESWANINAIDDLAEAIIRTQSHITVAALQGNAGAGGVFLARAADHVWLRNGVVLNPHYKDMGNLYGSEFWTYLLPRQAGEENARRITQARLPMAANEAVSLGLADACLPSQRADFIAEVTSRARLIAADPHFDSLLAEKRERRARDEAIKPLDAYRAEELQHMRMNFYGFDPSYHVARYKFVHKVPKSRTPVTIAHHRDKRLKENWRAAI